MGTDMPDSQQCPNCGARNPVTSGKCIVCGEPLQGSATETEKYRTWRIDEEDKELGNNISTGNTDTSNSSGSSFPVKPVLIAVLIACLIFLLVLILSRFISSGGGTTESSMESVSVESKSEDVASEESVREESASEESISQESVSEESYPEESTFESEKEENSTEDIDKYTADSLRMTKFGGETTGNGLVIHSDVHDNYNNKYDAGLGGKETNVENWTEYLIGDQFKYFSFRVVLNYERRTDVHPNTFVFVYADGRNIYQSGHVRSGYKPTDVTLDIRGVEKLKIGICGKGDIRVVDPILHNDEGFEQYSTMKPYSNKQDMNRVPLSYLEYWNGSSAEGGLKYDSGMIIDSTGKKYDGTFYGTHKDQNNWVSYDIADCGFTKFSGTIIMNPNPGGLDTVSPVVVIYENEWNRELYRSEPVKAGSAAQHFEVSLQNTKELKVQISGEYNVRIVDCYLSK